MNKSKVLKVVEDYHLTNVEYLEKDEKDEIENLIKDLKDCKTFLKDCLDYCTEQIKTSNNEILENVSLENIDLIKKILL